jgi:RNA polymerase sigma factor (sigma-70 family)
MGRKRAVVKWQDGSKDPYEERYQERPGKEYWAHMKAKTPFGFTEDGSVKESASANPDMYSDEDIERLDPEQSVKGSAQPSAEQILLNEAKKLLTEKQAQVWRALMMDELTGDEASDILGISQQMVSKHLSAARKKIQGYLQENAHRIKRDE